MYLMSGALSFVASKTMNINILQKLFNFMIADCWSDTMAPMF